MILPSQSDDRTSEVGYFEVDVRSLVGWLVERLSAPYSVEMAPGLRHESGFVPFRARPAGIGSFDDLSPLLQDRSALRLRLVVPVGRWTAMLTDGPLGTDLGVLPIRAVEGLGCRVVRAGVPEVDGTRPPGTMMDVYEPGVTWNRLGLRRTVSASDQGSGHWEFHQGGDPFDFEDLDAYRQRRIRDRFGPELLRRYLVELGVPVDGPFGWSDALVVERDLGSS